MSSSAILTALSSSNTGMGSGIDVASTVASMIAALRAPEIQWQRQQVGLQYQINALNQLNTEVSNLSTAIDALNDAGGAIGARSVTSSQSGIVTGSAANSAATGSHIVVVNNLASTASYYSDVVASSSTPLTTGDFTIQVGNGQATTITIDSSNNTLDGLAATINQKNLGVTASVVNDASGARLAIVSNSSGLASDLTISSVVNGLGFTKGASGLNASLTIDGIPVSSASNTVSGAVTGLTLNLLSSAPGTQVQIGISADTARVTQAIKDFVSSYNTLIQDLNAQFTYNSGTKSAGPLAGDSAARLVQNQLLGDISHSTNGTNGFNTLQSLGISMNNDGTLTVDDATLSDAVTNHYADVQTFFQAADGSGFASVMHTQLFSLSSPTKGAFNVEIKGNTDTQHGLQDQIDNFEVYIASQQQLLTTQYERVDVLLRELPLLQQQINAELGYTNNNSSSNR